jgi:hypothetical protein
MEVHPKKRFYPHNITNKSKLGLINEKKIQQDLFQQDLLQKTFTAYRVS